VLPCHDPNGLFIWVELRRGDLKQVDLIDSKSLPDAFEFYLGGLGLFI
jgi:hypothetical protein